MDKKSDLKGKKRAMAKKTLIGTDWQIYDIRLFGSQMGEVLTIVEGWIDSRLKSKWIATVNPEFVIKATKDEKFLDLLKETDLNVMDGIGLIWARELDVRCQMSDVRFWKKLMVGAKVGVEILKGKHKNELVSGADLMPELCKLAAKKGYKVFFLGGFGDRAERTALNLRSQFSDVSSQMDLKCQFCAGEPDISNEKVLEQINKFKPDILFVAYGMKKQEEWISKNRNKADFGVAIGVGRSFDYFSGDLKRAPLKWRKVGMEWLYSLIKEPKRIKRQVVLPKFIWKVLTK